MSSLQHVLSRNPTSLFHFEQKNWKKYPKAGWIWTAQGKRVFNTGANCWLHLLQYWPMKSSGMKNDYSINILKWSPEVASIFSLLKRIKQRASKLIKMKTLLNAKITFVFIVPVNTSYSHLKLHIEIGQKRITFVYLLHYWDGYTKGTYF